MAKNYMQINADEGKKTQKISFKTKEEKYSVKVQLFKKKQVEKQSKDILKPRIR